MTDCTTLQFTTTHIPSAMNHDAEELDSILHTIAEVQRGKRALRLLGPDAKVDMLRTDDGGDDRRPPPPIAPPTPAGTNRRARNPWAGRRGTRRQEARRDHGKQQRWHARLSEVWAST